MNSLTRKIPRANLRGAYVKLNPNQFPHFINGVINGWHEAKTNQPVFYNAAKTTQDERQAYLKGWRIGFSDHARPFLNHACLRGADEVKRFLTEEKIVEVLL